MTPGGRAKILILKLWMAHTDGQAAITQGFYTLGRGTQVQSQWVNSQQRQPWTLILMFHQIPLHDDTGEDTRKFKAH